MIYFHTKYVAPLMFNTTYIFFLQLYILGAVNSTVFLAMLNENKLLGVSLILFPIVHEAQAPPTGLLCEV